MYSDRVDSVTRATNPSLLPKPSLHSSRSSRSPRSSASTTIGSTFLSLSLFFSSPTLVLCFNAHPVFSLPLLTHRVSSDFSASYPSPPVSRYVSRCFFYYFVISSHLPFSRASSFTLFLLLLNISLRLVISHLGNSRMQSRSRMTEMPRNVSKVTIKLIIRDIGMSYGSNRGIRVQPFFRICDQLDTRSRRRKRSSSSPFFLSSS